MSDGAVTFRLQWIRALDTGKEMSAKSEDIELTLRPGESRSLDSVSVPPDKNTGRPCPIWDNRGKQIELSRVGLRVSVEYTPHESLERRLVGVDLWLIERVPGGAERTQSMSVRGLPHREIPFYFDAITEKELSLEVLGHVAASPEGAAIAVQLQTRSHLGPAGVRLARRQARADPLRRFAPSAQARRDRGSGAAPTGGQRRPVRRPPLRDPDPRPTAEVADARSAGPRVRLVGAARWSAGHAGPQVRTPPVRSDPATSVRTPDDPDPEPRAPSPDSPRGIVLPTTDQRTSGPRQRRSHDHRRAHSGVRGGSQDHPPRARARPDRQADVDAAHEIDVARQARHAPGDGAGGDFGWPLGDPVRVQGRPDAAAHLHRSDRVGPRRGRRNGEGEPADDRRRRARRTGREWPAARR